MKKLLSLLIVLLLCVSMASAFKVVMNDKQIKNSNIVVEQKPFELQSLATLTEGEEVLAAGHRLELYDTAFNEEACIISIDGNRAWFKVGERKVLNGVAILPVIAEKNKFSAIDSCAFKIDIEEVIEEDVEEEVPEEDEPEVEDNTEELVQKMFSIELLKNINFNACIELVEDEDRDFFFVKNEDTNLTVRDVDICGKEKDIHLRFLSREGLENQAKNPEPAKFVTGADGTDFYIMPSKYVASGSTIKNPDGFRQKFGELVSHVLSQQKRELFGFGFL